MTYRLSRRLISFLAVIALLVARVPVAEAAVAFDAASTASGVDNTSVTSLTWSHTTSGSDRVLLVGITANDATDADRIISSVTYNGVAMSQAVLNDDTARNLTAAIYRLVAPDTGAHDIVVTYAGTVSDAGAGAVSFTGVDQASPIDNTATKTTDNTNAHSLSITPVADSTFIFDTVVSAQYSGAATPGGSQTQRFNYESTAGTNMTLGSTRGPVSPAGATTMSWSHAVNLGIEDYRAVAVSVKPSGAAAPAAAPPEKTQVLWWQ